jgi:NAD(P)-dependent dehydrogenase (short-subunit alcohol dehydrogenase family)
MLAGGERLQVRKGDAVRMRDKVAVVTGGSSGIGRATVELLAREGARMLIGDISPGNEVISAVESAGGVAAFRRCDVTNEEEVQALLAEAVERWGRLDVLFNNAGMGMAKPIDQVSSAEFDRLFAVNVKGVYLGCKHALAIMLAQGSGSIINMSSNAGLLGRAADPLYSASKHAVVGLTKSLAITYAHRNVRVNAVCPGPIDTPMMWAGADSAAEREAALPTILASCPAARVADAEEVAAAVLFLASDESRFISGAALPIDGAKGAGIMPIERYRLDFAINS